MSLRTASIWRTALRVAALVLAASGAARGQAEAAPRATGTPLSTTAPTATSATAATTTASRFVLPLSRLAGNDRPVRLSSVAASTRVPLPMPALWQAESVKLELAGTASMALLAERSQLEVAVNGRVVQQFRLDGRQQAFRHEVAIPPGALRDGFNEVQIAVAQHYADRCEFATAPQLWTEIDLAASRFVVTATPKPAPLRLDHLAALFDKTGFDESPRIDVLTAAAPQGPVLAAMGLVAQGIGQYFDYVPVRIASGRLPPTLAALGAALAPGARGAVVLGTFEQVAEHLRGVPFSADAGPLAALRPIPGDATRFALVLAAHTEAELALVATAFAMPRMPWPDRDWVQIQALTLPPADAAGSGDRSRGSATQAFPLNAVGYKTTTFSGPNAGGASVRFWNGSWQGRAQLRMHLMYGSGMSAQSVLNVMANGAMHGSIPLERATGGVYDNYTVSLPTGALKPGWNTLELQPVLVPQTADNGGDCKPFFPGSLAVTIYDDSTLQTFGGSALQRPDLGLMLGDAVPAASAAAGAGLAVQLTDADDTTVGAGLTLTAKLAQVARGPLLRARLLVGADADATHRIWLGPLGRLPKTVLAAVGLADAGRMALPVPLLQSIDVPVLEGGGTLQRLREAIDGTRPNATTASAEVRLDLAPVHNSIAVTALEQGRPLTVLTAATPEALLAGVHEIVGYGAWAQLRGHFATWRPGSPKMLTVAAEDAPFTAYSLRGGLGLWVSQYPWWALLVLLAVMAATVLMTRIVLANYRRRHLPSQAGQRRDDGAAH